MTGLKQKPDGTYTPTAPGWMLLIALGGGTGTGGALLSQAIAPSRPDPFTGSQGRQMEMRLNHNMVQLNAKHVDLEKHMDAVIARMEARIDAVSDVALECRGQLRAVGRQLERQDKQ